MKYARCLKRYLKTVFKIKEWIELNDEYDTKYLWEKNRNISFIKKVI